MPPLNRQLVWTAAIGFALLLSVGRLAGAQSAPAPQSNAPSSGGQSKSAAQSKSGAQGTAAKQPATDANPKPCSVIPEPDPCGTTPKPPAASGSSAPSTPPNAMDKFPFPGSGAADSSSAPAPSIGGVPDTPQPSAASPQSPSADTEKKFPFPGESSAPAAPAAPDAPVPGAGSSSSSSSNDAGDLPDSGAPDLKDAGSEGAKTQPGRHILHRVNPAAPKPQTPDERESEDLDVAKFYQNGGDLQGAYLRTQDAVKTAPDDPDAHFAMAEIAAKLGKKDEAIAEYNACLKLDPSDKEKKESNKALARLAR